MNKVNGDVQERARRIVKKSADRQKLNFLEKQVLPELLEFLDSRRRTERNHLIAFLWIAAMEVATFFFLVASL